MAGTDALAETLVEIIADTSQFRGPVVKEMEATAIAAGEALDKGLSESMGKAAKDSADEFGAVLKRETATESAEAGAGASSAWRSGFASLGELAQRAAREAAEAMGLERPRFTAEGAEDGRAFSLGLKKAADTGAEEAGSSAAQKFGAFAKTGFFAVGAAAAGATGAITAFGIKSAGDLQQTQVAFTQLTGSAENAQKEIAALQTFAANTPFEFKDVAQSAAKLLAVGDAAGITQQNLIPVLTTIGDVGSAFGVSGDQINGAVNALAQIAGAGKFDMGNLNQISDNLGGFPARAVLAQQAAQLWGVSTEEALKRIGEGALPAQQGIQLLLEGMKAYPGAAGGMEKQSATLNGVLSTFADTAKNSLSAAFAPAIPQITAALGQLVPVMQDALGKLGPVISGTLLAILPLAGQFVTTFATVMQPIVPILADLAPAFGQLLAVAGPLFASLVTAISPLFGPLNNILVLFTQLVQAVLPPLIPIVRAVADSIAKSGLSDALFGLFDAIKPLIPVLTGALVAAFVQLTPLIPTLVDAVAQLAISLVPLIPPLAQIAVEVLALVTELAKMGILDIVIPFINELAKGITILLPVLKPMLEAFALWVVISKAITIATAALNLVMDANPIVLIGIAVIALVGGLVTLYQKFAVVREIVAAVFAPMKAVGEFIASVFVAAWRALGDAVSAVVQWFQDFPALISAGLAQVQALLSSTWQAIIGAAGAVLDWFVALPGRILDALLALPGQLLDLFLGGLSLLLKGIGEAIGLIVVAFVLLVREVIFAVTELPGMLWDLFTSALSKAYDAVVAGGKQLIAWATSAVLAIGREIAALPGQLYDLFTSAVTSAYNAVLLAGVKVIGWFEQLPGRLVNAISSLASVIGRVFSDMWAAAQTIVSTGIDKLVGWFKAIPGHLADAGASMIEAGKNLISKIFDGFAQVPSIGANLAKSVVNAIIHAINWAIKQVNDGLSQINIAGVGFGKETIPPISDWKALGGVFDKPTTIGVGEAGREVVLPLTNPDRAAQLAQQSGLLDVLARTGAGGGGQTINMTVQTVAQNPEIVAGIVVGRLARMGG